VTTINALRLNYYSGIIITDEERTWHLRQRLNSIEKMKSIVPADIENEYDIFIRLATTGTCSFGTELLRESKKKIRSLYEKELEKRGKKPEKFLTLEDISHLIYENMMKLKHRHIDELLVGKYGFNTGDYTRGYYMSGDKKIEIKDKEVLKGAEEIITWSKRTPETNKVFGNMAIVAGYEPQEGFRIFHMSIARNTCEPVPFIFQIDGSGADIAETTYNNYASNMTFSARRGDIDPLEALVMMLRGFLEARRICIEVGGWPNILYINAKEKSKKKKVREFDDNRAKLASEIVDSYMSGLISRGSCYSLIEELIFNDGDFETLHLKFWKSSKNPLVLSRFLRGHKMC